jgi:WD40 repeat protein
LFFLFFFFFAVVVFGSVFNTDGAISSLGTYSDDCLFCVSDLGGVTVWDLDSEDRIASFQNLRESSVWDVTINYVVDCSRTPSSRHKLWAIAGTFEGMGLVMKLNVKKSTVKPVAALANGHSEVIRGANVLEDRLITISEDGKVCLWSFPVDAEEAEPSQKRQKRE